MINILIFPSGSLVAKEIYDALKFEKNINCFGTDYDVDNVSSYYMENYIPNCPFIKDEELTISFLNTIVKSNNIKYIYPAFDSIINFLKKNEKNIGCTIIAPSINTINICESKLLTYNLFKDIIPCPKQINKDDFINDLDYPVYVKPIIGYGSRDHSKCNRLDELMMIDTSKYLLLEYLPGDEFTVDCFSDKNNKLLFAQARQRLKTLNGISIQSKTIDLPDIFEYAKKIQEILQFNGAWFFQVKYDKTHTLKLLEIACRVPGAMCTNRVKGINFPLLTIMNYEGIDTEPLAFNNINIICYKIYNNYYKTKLDYKHVYVDLDDTLIIKGKINTLLIKFLYECINNDKSLYLITRNENPHIILNKYKINIFNKIYQLTTNHDEDPKSKYIEYTNSIFIDDSFRERYNVKSKKNIPCFSPSEVELLITTL